MNKMHAARIARMALLLTLLGNAHCCALMMLRRALRGGKSKDLLLFLIRERRGVVRSA